MGSHPDRGVGRPTAVLVILATITLVAAILVLVTLFAAPDGEEDSQARDDASTTTPSAPECPPAPAGGETDPIDEPDPDAPAAVPADPTSVILCQGPGTELDDAELAITTGHLGDIVGAVNSSQPIDEPELCAADHGPGFRLVFGYDDGSTFVVSGKLYGCHELVVGSGYRADADSLYYTYLERYYEP